MKKVVSGLILLEKMESAVHLICDTVKSTLGPKGKNVIIDHSSFEPFITNDGVTIAQNIESDDEVIQTILTFTKEASIHTNEYVGDGTTTTLVLLETIFDNGLELIKKGYNPIILKRELEEALKEIQKQIENKSRKASKEELKQIAIVSANSKEIGELISEAYLKVGSCFAVELKEHEKTKTKLNYIKGYQMPTMLASPYFLKESKKIELASPYIMLVDGVIGQIEQIASILNWTQKEDKNLVIIAPDFLEEFVNDILAYNLETKFSVYLLKVPEYGLKQQEILKDLSSISKASVIRNTDSLSEKRLGTVKNVVLSKESTIFHYSKNTEVRKREKEIQKQVGQSQNDIELEWNRKRLSNFQKGCMEVWIGAYTTTERREKKMRFEDALCAIDTAKRGIVPGSGIVLLEISEKIDSKTNGYNILKEAIKMPFFQILINAGADEKKIYDYIKNSDFTFLYNSMTGEYEPTNNTKILDSTKVLLESLTNAVSIASMLLTTNHLIINEYKNEINKVNDYNEL